MDLIVHEVPLDSSYLKDRAYLVSRSALGCRRRPSRYVNKSSGIEPRLKAARHVISRNSANNSGTSNPRERRRRRTVSDTVNATFDRRSPDPDKPSKKSAVLIQTWERRSQTENGKPDILCNGNVPNRTEVVITNGCKSNGHSVNDSAKMPGRPVVSNDSIKTTNFSYTCCNGSAKPQGFLKGKSTKQNFNARPLTRPRSLHNLSNVSSSSNEEPEWISLSRKLCAKFIQSHLDKDSNEVVTESRVNGSQAKPVSRTPKPTQNIGSSNSNFKIPAVQNNRQQSPNGDVPQWVNLSKKLCTKFIEEHIECEPCNEDAKPIPLLKNGLDLEKTSDIRIIEKIGKKDEDKTKQKHEELPEWVTLSRRLRAKFIEGHKDDPDTISLDNQLNASDLEEYFDNKYRRGSAKDDEGRKYVIKKDELQRTPNNGADDYKNFINGRLGPDYNENRYNDDPSKKYCYWSDIAPRNKNISNVNSCSPNGHDYTRDMTPRTRRFFEDEDDVSYELTFETFETEDSVSQDSGTVSGRSSENEPFGEGRRTNSERDSSFPLKETKLKSKSMGDLMRCHDDADDSVCSYTQIDGSRDNNNVVESKKNMKNAPARDLSKSNGNGLSLWRNFCEASTNTSDSLDVKFHDSVQNDCYTNKKSTAVGTDHALSSYADTVRIKVNGPFSNGVTYSQVEDSGWDTIESSSNIKQNGVHEENGKVSLLNHKQHDMHNDTEKHVERSEKILKRESKKFEETFSAKEIRTENHNGGSRPMMMPNKCRESSSEISERNVTPSNIVVSCTDKCRDRCSKSSKKNGTDEDSFKDVRQSSVSQNENVLRDKSNSFESIDACSKQCNNGTSPISPRNSTNGVNERKSVSDVRTESFSIAAPAETKEDLFRSESPIYESMRPFTDIGPQSFISDDSLTYESIPQATKNTMIPERNSELPITEKDYETNQETSGLNKDGEKKGFEVNGFSEHKYGSPIENGEERVVASRNKEFTIRKVYEDVSDYCRNKSPSVIIKPKLKHTELDNSKTEHYYDEVSIEPEFGKHPERTKEFLNAHDTKPREEKHLLQRIEDSVGHPMNGDSNSKDKKQTSKVMSYTSISSNHVMHRKDNLHSVELPESNSSSSRRAVISVKEEKKRVSSKVNDKLSSYQPINSPFEFETFEIPSLCSPENKSILQKHEAELNRANGCASDEHKEIRRYESSDSETPGSSPFDVRTLMSPSSCASDSEVSSWTLTQNNSYGDRNSPGNAEADFSDCSMSVKCDCNPECSSEQNTMESRGVSAQQRRRSKESDQGTDTSKKLDPRTRFSEVFVDCETSKNWKKSRSLDHLEEKASSSSNFYVNLDEDGPSTTNLAKSTDDMEAMPESLRHIFNLPMNPIYTPAAKTNMLLSRTAEPPRSHYYSAATPALSSSSFKQQAQSKPKKSERSSSLKIKDIAQGIILTFRKFHSHSKSSNLSSSVDVSHLAETNSPQQKECSEIHQKRLMRNAVTDYGNMNGRMLSAGYFGSRSTSESNLYMPPNSQLLSCPGKLPKKSKEDCSGRPLSFNFGKIPEGKKSKGSKKTPEMKEKKVKTSQGKTKHKSNSGEGTVSSVSRKIQKMADGTLCLVTTVSGGTNLPGVYSDTTDAANVPGAPRARQLGESNC